MISTFVANFLLRFFFPVYKRNLATIVAQQCPEGAYILDLGCDDGYVAKTIMELKPSVTIVGVDIQDIRPCAIPRKIYDGLHIPYADDTFDLVMALDMLHHTQTIPELVKEMRRVSKHQVLIKDHMVSNVFTFWMICFTDYLTNAPFGISCAYNFLTTNKWKEIFNTLELKLTHMPKNLNFGFGLSERFNPVFILEKDPASTEE